MDVLYVEQVDALLEAAIQDNKAAPLTVYVVGARIVHIQDLLLQLMLEGAVPESRRRKHRKILAFAFRHIHNDTGLLMPYDRLEPTRNHARRYDFGAVPQEFDVAKNEVFVGLSAYHSVVLVERLNVL